MKNSTFSKENQTEINNIMDAIKVLTREKDEKENQLNEFKQKLYDLVGLDSMDESEKITTDRWAVSFMVKHKGLKFDSKKFQKEQPKLYEEYKTQVTAGSKYLDYSKCKEI